MMGSLRWWFAGAVLAIAAGIGWALWRAPQTVELPAATAPETPGGSGASQPAPYPAPPVLADGGAPPPGVSAAQWAALQQEFAGRPTELRRLDAYFRFADQLQRFRALPRDGAPERRALAQALDQGLDERLRQRELGAGEARQIKLAVLQALQPDEGQRAAALQQWETATAVANPPDTHDTSRNAEYQRRQAELVAAWSARPAAQRDPRALEQDLDALRRASFGAGPKTTAGGSR